MMTPLCYQFVTLLASGWEPTPLFMELDAMHLSQLWPSHNNLP